MRLLSACLSCGVLLCLVGCGGAATTPSSPAPSPVTPTFQPGTYSFVVSQGSGASGAPDGSFNSWICLGVGSFPTSVRVPVTVQRDGSTYQARALNGSLLLTLTVSGLAASGTVLGNAADGTGAFSLSVEGAQPVSINGTITNDYAASGTVDGKISLRGPGGYGGCSPLNWSLIAS